MVSKEMWYIYSKVSKIEAPTNQSGPISIYITEGQIENIIITGNTT